MTASDIEDRLDRKQRLELLQEQVTMLPERDRMVLTLYYFHELKLREIAEVLGLTESRVSQIRTRALELLRSRVQHLAEDAA
jgi:RNA polymerase sigma factor for flagellar operon FliA